MALVVQRACQVADLSHHGADGCCVIEDERKLLNLEMLCQLVPSIRLDGYWALADVTGVPDFISYIGAFVRGLLRGVPRVLATAWDSAAGTPGHQSGSGDRRYARRRARLLALLPVGLGLARLVKRVGAGDRPTCDGDARRRGLAHPWNRRPLG